MKGTTEDHTAKISLTHPLASTEATDLFQNLWSWKEESNKHFSTIAKSYCNNIDNRIRALVEEVEGLKAELSDMRQEKTALLETIDDLDGEIEQLNAKLRASSGPGYYLNKSNSGEEIQDSPECDIKIPEITSHVKDSLFIVPTNGDEVTDYVETDLVDAKEVQEMKDGVGMLDQHQKEEKSRPIIRKKQRNHFDKPGINGRTKAKRYKACHLCEFSAMCKGNLDYHMTSVHKIGKPMLKCKGCPYQNPSKGNLKRHIEKQRCFLGRGDRKMVP